MATLATDQSTKTGLVGNLVVAALVVLLGYQLAHWTWVFVAPAPVAAVPDGEPAMNLAAVAKLFGAGPPANSSGATISCRVSSRA